MKKAVIFFVLVFAFCGLCFSQTGNTVTVTIEITNVVVDGGTVYLAIFATSDSFKKEVPEIAFELKADKTSLIQEVTLARGEYVVSALQDANGNKVLDYGLFGIPKELVGISNYSGKGFPSKNFDKQKILLDEKTGKVVIGLYKF
jgi:uncharacterized protein (DUF2141 family)